MKSYSSREIIKLLEKSGWYHVKTRGDHCYFKHPTKQGKITVTHPAKDVDPLITKNIFKMAGLPDELIRR